MNTIKPATFNNSEKTIFVKNRLSTNHPPYSPSFKSAPYNISAEASKQIMGVFSQHYGNIGDRLGQKINKLVTSSKILEKSSRISIKEGALSIREKSVIRGFGENLIFPFINLPLYAVSWVFKRFQSIPSMKDWARKIYDKPILRIPRKLNELDEKTDMLKGMLEKTQDTIAKFAKERGVTKEYLIAQLNKTDDTPQSQQLVKEANEYIKESLYKVSNKFFDKHTGNFNTAYERPLNRIVTGLIPVAFLANDAYNLSVMCGDKKEDSLKEANERKIQEISRVLTTAYIQLITFGAFTKQVNTLPWFTPLTSALTVLFSETSSRKRLGKPVFFLSPEKAKEYNRREKELEESQEKENNNKLFSFKKQETKTKELTPAEAAVKNLTPFVSPDSEPKVFTSFKASNNNKNTNSAETINNKATEKNDKKERKALINFDTFKKAVAILLASGFTLSFLKNSSYTKNAKIITTIKDFGKKCKEKIYNPLAFKDFEITSSEFEVLAQNLKDVGCKEIAEGHSFIKSKYGRMTADGTIKMFKGKLEASKAAQITVDALESLINNGTKFSEADISKIKDSVKIAINQEGTAITEMKYGAVAKKAIEIISNKKVNLSPENIETLKKAITESVTKNATEIPIQIDTKLKPFVDIVTEPFKFIMSALRLPFKCVTLLINLAVSPVEKKAAEALIGKAELTKFEKAVHKVITEIYGEKKAKAGKTSQVIFANAMEKLQKQTKPYRMAKEMLEKATVTGSVAEIKKAEAALDKAKNDLARYVNTAVEKSFNGVTQSSNKNTDLAMMTKLASSAVTSAFLVADNYNMVMIKSNGEDKQGAKETANERIIQRLSALFYQALFINWFNATFRATYNSSLRGMTEVAIPNTLTTEILTRKSIGMPVGRKTYEELQEIDEKNENRKGFLGKYFKFMRLLTGKKPLKDRLPKEQKNQQKTKETPVNILNNSLNKTISTNLLDKYLIKQ